MLRFGFIKIKNNNSSNYYIGLLPQTKNEDYWVQKDTNPKIHILAILNSLFSNGWHNFEPTLQNLTLWDKFSLQLMGKFKLILV